jgi:hypothetical protein
VRWASVSDAASDSQTVVASEGWGQNGASSSFQRRREQRHAGSLSFQRRREIGLAHLWAYVREHGTACVPRLHESPDGYRLGIWVHVRRQKRGEAPALDKLLEALPGWTWAPFDDVFEEKACRFESAVANGSVRGDQELARWMAAQRAKARSGALRLDRRARLVEAGVLRCAPAQD